MGIFHSGHQITILTTLLAAGAALGGPLQAEIHSFSNGSIKSHADASAGLYVDLNEGGSVSFTSMRESDIQVDLAFRIKSPSGPRAMGVFVNNSRVGQISSSSANWVYAPVNGIQLKGGLNQIELRDTENTMEFDVDKIEVRVDGEKGWFSDSRDNQKYQWVQIGSQKWMAENLNYNSPSGDLCYNDCLYGRLYNRITALTSQGNGYDICPAGWHVSSYSEWQTLEKYVNGYETPYYRPFYTAAQDLKAARQGGTDRFGFKALPGGNYWSNFYGLNESATFFAKNTTPSNTYILTLIYNDFSFGSTSSDTEQAFSVRCIEN